MLPDEWNAFEFSQGVTLHELDVSKLGLCLIGLGEHEVEDELLSPENDALNDVE